VRLRTLPCCSSSSSPTQEPQPRRGHSRDSNRGKPSPGSKPSPRSRPNASPNRFSSLIVGRCQNAARWVQYAPAKYFAKFPTLTVARGRKCRYSACVPCGFFDISTHDREQMRGRQAESRSLEHPPLLQTKLGPHPRTSNAGWPEVVAGGVDSKTPPPTRISSREATARPIHRHPTLAGTSQECRSSQYERRYPRNRREAFKTEGRRHASPIRSRR
jgi:hypothetical protein